MSVRSLHDAAMRLAQDAIVLRDRGYTGEAQRLAGEALVYERQAAKLVERKPESEPTRSILYRSAATLAMRAGDPDEARSLVAEGLSGWPPPHVERELRELLAADPATR